MPKKKAKLSAEDEEKIINFVKSHDILYNTKHKRFRNTIAKNRLWFQLANQVGMDAEVIKKKWRMMRDYFIRSKERKTPDLAATNLRWSKRDKSLAFLLETSNNYSISSLARDVGPGPSTDQEEQNSQSQVDDSDDTNSNACELSCFNDSISQVPILKEESVSSMSESDSNERLKEIFAKPKLSDLIQERPNDDIQICSVQRPKPKVSKIMPGTRNDDIQNFFMAMASTVRKFSPLARARIKLKINQIVGEQEIYWAEEETAVPRIYLKRQSYLQNSTRHN